MDIPETYDYLVRSRRDLWTVLEGVPDQVLSHPLLGGERFHCIKDLVFHVPDVEDGWLHGDLLGEPMVQETFPALREGGPDFAGFALETLLDYWRAVEQSTLGYLARLDAAERARVVTVEDWPPHYQRFKLSGLLWHVMLHEVRHTAQIAVLLRTQGIKPPSLDLLFYLPTA